MFLELNEEDAGSGSGGSGDGESTFLVPALSATFQCASSGSWTGPTTRCYPRDCGPFIFGLDENANANCLQGDTTFGGDNCQATCDPGYEAIYGTGVYQCGINGRWVGDLECQIRDCGDLSEFLDANTTDDCQSTTYGSECTATCDLGFNGGKSAFSCGTTGTWQGNLECTRIQCPTTVPMILNGASNCSDSFYNQSCYASCDSGYELVSGDFEFVCGLDGQWQGSLQCQKKDCGDIKDVLGPNSTALPCSSTAFQDECFATCDLGFVTTGDGVFTCDPSGQWSGELSCTRVTCGSLEDSLGRNQVVANNSLTCNQANNTCVTASATCAPGYEAAASGDYFCGLNGQWISSLRCRRKDCGPILPIGEGAAHTVCLDSLFEGTCSAFCQNGYEIKENTSQQYTCSENGWMGDLVCEKMDCGSFEAFLNSTELTTQCNETAFGSRCRAVCQSPLVQVGSNLFECSSTGQWRGGCGLECLGMICCCICFPPHTF